MTQPPVDAPSPDALLNDDGGALVAAVDRIRGQFRAFEVETPAYVALSAELKGLKGVVEIIGQTAKMAAALGMTGPSVSAIEHVAAELAIQLVEVETAAQGLNDAIDLALAASQALDPLLAERVARLDTTPATATGALFALNRINSALDTLPGKRKPPASAVAAIAVVTDVSETVSADFDGWTTAIQACGDILGSIEAAAAKALAACRGTRRTFVRLSDDRIAKLLRLGAVADQAATIVTAVQILKEAAGGRPSHVAVPLDQLGVWIGVEKGPR